MKTLGNTKLVRYGVRDSKADLHIHIGVETRTVYIYEPRNGIKAMDSGKYSIVPVFTGRINTATGYLIKPEEIEGCKSIPIPDPMFKKANFDKRDNPSMKARKAERLASDMIRAGLVPLVINSTFTDDQGMQIEGSDLEFQIAQSWQVKCDWRGGNPYLFLQDREANPLGFK